MKLYHIASWAGKITHFELVWDGKCDISLTLYSTAPVVSCKKHCLHTIFFQTLYLIQITVFEAEMPLDGMINDWENLWTLTVIRSGFCAVRWAGFKHVALKRDVFADQHIVCDHFYPMMFYFYPDRTGLFMECIDGAYMVIEWFPVV